MTREKIFINLSKKHKVKISDLTKKLKKPVKFDNNQFDERGIGSRKVLDKKKFSDEQLILFEYYKLVLKEVFSIKFQNRNSIIDELLNILPHSFKYSSLTIFRFDFSDFFRKIDPQKIYSILEKNSELLSYELEFLSELMNRQNLSPGLGIMNVLVEIISKEFDNKVEEIYREDLIYYARYVDDCILVLDNNISEKLLLKTITDIAITIFGINMKLNRQKQKYLSLPQDTPLNIQIDYLGYAFCFSVSLSQSNKTTNKFSFGIATEKIEKEIRKVNQIVEEFKLTQNEKLLLKKFDIYFKRLTFFDSEEKVWKSFGISSNYSKIKQLIIFDNISKEFTFKRNSEAELLNKKTQEFLELKFIDQTDLPKTLIGQIKNKKFIASLYHNRSVLINSKIGLNYINLVDYLTDCNLNIYGKKSYRDLQYKFLANLTIKNPD